jgi:hypothetical protein
MKKQRKVETLEATAVRAADAFENVFGPVKPDPQVPYVYQLMLDELQAIRKLLAVIASPPAKEYSGPG